MACLPSTSSGAPRSSASLDRVLAALDRGGSAALEIVGEPGIGKTRLLAELADRADARGHLVLVGIGVGARARPALLGIRRCARRVSSGASSRDRLDALDEDVRNGLAGLPVALGFATTEGAAFQHERYRGHRAVRELLERLTAIRPLVLVLDDIHWADSASVDLLGSLLRRPPDAAVLLVAGRCGRGRRRSGCRRRSSRPAGRHPRSLELGALTRAEAGELSATAVDETTAARSVRGERWQPLLSRAARQGGRVARPAPRSTSRSDSLADLRRSAAGRRRAGRGARAPPARRASRAARARRRRRSIRPRACDGCSRVEDIVGARCGRRAASTRPDSRDRRAAPLSLSASARSTRGVRVDAWRVATRRARAMRRGARRPRCRPGGTRTPRRACREAGRRGRRRDVARRRERRRPSRAGERRTLVRGRASTARRRRAGRRARRAAALARGSVGHTADTSPKRTPRSSRRIELVPDEAVALRVRLTTACAGVEHLLGRHEDAYGRLARALEGLEDANSPEAARS